MTTVVCAKLAALGAYQLAAKLLEFAHSHPQVAKWVCDVVTKPPEEDKEEEKKDSLKETKEGTVLVLVRDSPWCVNTQLYLVASGRIGDANDMTIERVDEVRCETHREGVHERRMLVLASAFADNSYPLGASIVYRAVVKRILSRGNPEDYTKACDCLITLKILALAIRDWHGNEDHNAFMAALRKRHRSKSVFWKAYGHKLGIRLEKGGVSA